MSAPPQAKAPNHHTNLLNAVHRQKPGSCYRAVRMKAWLWTLVCVCVRECSVKWSHKWYVKVSSKSGYWTNPAFSHYKRDNWCQKISWGVDVESGSQTLLWLRHGQFNPPAFERVCMHFPWSVTRQTYHITENKDPCQRVAPQEHACADADSIKRRVCTLHTARNARIKRRLDQEAWNSGLGWQNMT
jgi:hypothetical protein